ncbi:MAG: DUF1624 domain-containing protein [Ignavibacteriae bacterium]|nr:DUF1624 domain-containing protein [Ignavibacteriota bacterium]
MKNISLNNLSKRIIYVDLMRAFAVIMMIQGHTVDTLLADQFRNTDYLGYNIWNTMRGFTAPIFMFTAGLIFTYLLKSDHFEFSKNPRVKKGIKRGFLLIGIGYLLRYPTGKIVDFSNVTQAQWNIFFSVDALHLIGLGLLFVILSLFIAKKLKVKLYFIIIGFILLFLIFSPVINQIEWNNYLPQIISSYLTKSYGSFFPAFPWLVYVLSGALLGSYLYRNEGIYLKKRFSISLSILGSSLIFASFLTFYIQNMFNGNFTNWIFSNGIILLRVGYVILLNGILAFIVRKVNSIPEIIQDTGKHTLALYVIHVIILYGCAWFPGMYKYFSKSFTPVETIISAILMLLSMLFVVQLIGKINDYKKRKILLNKI